MKSQKHNLGELGQLTVKIEKSVIETIQRMAVNSGKSVDEIVVVALKRFRSSHSELEGHIPRVD
jgi:hypothetical protein